MEGLGNTGNDCYMNVCVVALRYLRPFTDELYTSLTSQNRMVHLLDRLVQRSVRVEDVVEFRTAMHQTFSTGQEDAHCCLLHILGQLPDKFFDLFKVTSVKTTRCTRCHRSTTAHETNSFHRPDALDAEALQVDCEACGRATECIVTHKAAKAPKILLVVQGPAAQGLDVQGRRYSLRVAICHIGTAYAGHYVAFVLDKGAGKITCHDDTRVRPVSAEFFQKFVARQGHSRYLFYV